MIHVSDFLSNWVSDQTNSALQGQSDVISACNKLSRQHLILHPDNNKNWDSFLAIYHAAMTTDTDDPILDAGAGDESAFLPSLKQLGFYNLLGINLDRKDDYKAGVRGGIRYAYGDITSTPFPNEIFPFIACLSVIEHGVDVRAFLLEMSRILAFGGHLFISFDYWDEKIDTAGLITHDAVINIFSEDEVNRLLAFASTCGLCLIGEPWRPICRDRVINWAGRGYTFGNVLLRKLRE
jgi:SAM-dependent methyltransferase